MITSDTYSLIVGMGATGLSIARYLSKRGERFCLFDTRSDAALAKQFTIEFPAVNQYFATLGDDVIASAKELVLSPGVSREENIVVKALQYGKPVIGDIELFLREAKAPVIGITGSNGKSTVTTLLGLIAKSCGLNVGVGGNIGIPALELLDASFALYILELSSFQLESTSSPHLEVACVLNISPDHMDRYNTLADYVTAKQRIFWGAKHVVYSLDDPLTRPPIAKGVERYGFGFPHGAELEETAYTFSPETGWLLCGGDRLIQKDDIKIKGLHNIRNALACFAICDAAGIRRAACCDVLQRFTGLPHRCEWVTERNGVTFINDSKATNVGAAEAAIRGLAPEYNGIILIAGGDGKGASFSELGKNINACVRVLVLIGTDAQKIAGSVAEHVKICFASTMESAVQVAESCAEYGDVILLAPACASFDMFANFEERGQMFVDAVMSGKIKEAV